MVLIFFKYLTSHSQLVMEKLTQFKISYQDFQRSKSGVEFTLH